VHVKGTDIKLDKKHFRKFCKFWYLNIVPMSTEKQC